MKRYIREEKGSITLFVLLTILLFVVIISGAYIASINKQKKILKSADEIANNYKVDESELEGKYAKIQRNLSVSSDISSLLDRVDALETTISTQANEIQQLQNENDEKATQIQQLQNSQEYHKGDEVILSNWNDFVGHVTSATKELYFTVPLGKNIGSDVTSVTVSSTAFNIRHATGGYLINSSYSGSGSNIGDYFTLTTKSNNIVSFHYIAESAFSTTNNSPICFNIYNLKITFK